LDAEIEVKTDVLSLEESVAAVVEHLRPLLRPDPTPEI
jgi:hypothetical protein